MATDFLYLLQYLRRETLSHTWLFYLQPQVKPEDRRSPVCTRIRLKIFPFFLRAREAVNMFPACIQVSRAYLTVVGTFQASAGFQDSVVTEVNKHGFEMCFECDFSPFRIHAWTWAHPCLMALMKKAVFVSWWRYGLDEEGCICFLRLTDISLLSACSLLIKRCFLHCHSNWFVLSSSLSSPACVQH